MTYFIVSCFFPFLEGHIDSTPKPCYVKQTKKSLPFPKLRISCTHDINYALIQKQKNSLLQCFKAKADMNVKVTGCSLREFRSKHLHEPKAKCSLVIRIIKYCLFQVKQHL